MTPLFATQLRVMTLLSATQLGVMTQLSATQLGVMTQLCATQLGVMTRAMLQSRELSLGLCNIVWSQHLFANSNLKKFRVLIRDLRVVD
jgi:hypothetical protein